MVATRPVDFRKQNDGLAGIVTVRPKCACLTRALKTSDKLGLDETTVRVLDPGRGKTKTGYMWTMMHDERPWCSADLPGTVQVNGYSGHNRLRRSDRPDGALILAACWAHARRGLK